MKNFLVNSALTVFSALVFFFLVEIGLQLTEYRNYIPPRYSPINKMRHYYEKDDTLGNNITPNFRDGEIVFLDGTHAVFSNSFGCFDEEDKVPERYILLVGDGFTWGFAPYEKKWGTILQRLLDYRVVKCGVSGSGTKYQVLKARKVVP